MKVVVIGGGPAGMMEAYTAAIEGHAVTLLEKNEKLGKKLYITGKGRCNLCNACDADGFFRAVKRNPRFLYSAWAGLDSAALMDFFEQAGLPLKVERGNRVFPASDKSSDVLRTMERLLRSAGVKLRLNSRVLGLVVEDGAVTGVRLEAEIVPAEACIVATGGISYPSTGSTGDGYAFAQAAGHRVAEPVASLVPLTTRESWPYALSGFTLKNARLTARRGGKTIFSELGEMLFTHFGVSGPLVLSLSSVIAEDPAGTALAIDLKPGLTAEQLEARLLRDLAENARKSLHGALHALLPARLLDTVLGLAGLDGAMPVGEFTKAQRARLIETLKALPLTVKGSASIDEAVITRGGVAVGEINASTMASKKLAGLYFAGEVLDVDAVTGGYNLQIAWSTGACAGRGIQ